MIRIESQGFKAVRRRIHGMRERAQNLIPAWEALLDWWAKSNSAQFRTRGKRWGTPWKPLAPATIQEKVRLGYPRAPLIRTGDLRKSLAERPLDIERLKPQEMSAGTAVKYARFHQGGTRHMPARKLVNARAVQEDGAATRAVRNWIVKGNRNARHDRGSIT